MNVRYLLRIHLLYLMVSAGGSNPCIRYMNDSVGQILLVITGGYLCMLEFILFVGVPLNSDIGMSPCPTY